jgi:biopolymer transport protein ExbB
MQKETLTMLLNFLLQVTSPVASTATTTATQPAVPSGTIEISLFDYIVKGGVIMIPLGILFLLAIYFAIERLIVISKAARTDRTFMPNVRDMLLSGRIESAMELCKTRNTPEARVIARGMSRLGKPSREIEVAMEATGRQELAFAEKRMHYLNLIARVAPMLGFIGTIIGVVQIFFKISQSGDISIETISGGLYTKMVASGAGLFVGIVAFVLYHLLNTMIDKMANNIERSSLAFLDLMHEPTK